MGLAMLSAAVLGGYDAPTVCITAAMHNYHCFYALLPNWKPCYVMARHLTIACAARLTLYQARTSTPEMDNPVHTIKATYTPSLTSITP